MSSKSARVTHGKFAMDKRLRYNAAEAPAPTAYNPNVDAVKPGALCNTMSKSSLKDRGEVGPVGAGGGIARTRSTNELGPGHYTARTT